jgi:hypothetical protein
MAKFATHVVLFGQDKWIMRNIANAYPHVERIYIAYSEKPWAYNPNAQNLYKNSFDLDLIRKSEYYDKITIIEGHWNTEEEQRNACANQADKDGMDFLIIHDADEFYFNSAFEWIKKYVEENPQYDYYKIAWYCFWKTFNNILLDSAGNKIVGYPEFCINLKHGVKFASKRRPNKTLSQTIPPYVGICYHGSYVLTDQELLQKINTWGHTNDFNKDYWYNNIWLRWKPEMRNLHLVSPTAWSQAVPFNDPLPEVIVDMK